jgi:hypothetical protein
MPITTRTTTHAVDKTIMMYTPELGDRIKDGGRKFFNEVLDLIQKNQQVGTLTIQFGTGGSVSTVAFEEKQLIPQKDVLRY